MPKNLHNNWLLDNIIGGLKILSHFSRLPFFKGGTILTYPVATYISVCTDDVGWKAIWEHIQIFTKSLHVRTTSKWAAC